MNYIGLGGRGVDVPAPVNAYNTVDLCSCSACIVVIHIGKGSEEGGGKNRRSALEYEGVLIILHSER